MDRGPARGPLCPNHSTMMISLSARFFGANASKCQRPVDHRSHPLSDVILHGVADNVICKGCCLRKETIITQ